MDYAARVQHDDLGPQVVAGEFTLHSLFRTIVKVICKFTLDISLWTLWKHVDQ